MEKTLFSDRGLFQWWIGIVSHRHLLLRSIQSSDRPSQIDVLFAHVRVAHLPTSFIDLEVLETDQYPLEGIVTHEMSNAKVFVIRGQNIEGYVIASAVFRDEGDLKYYDRSPLWTFGAWPDEI